MGMFRTPLISTQREDGSTFYTFSSAMEDIGLNINERNNKVYLSRYVLLNLPDIGFSTSADLDSIINMENFFYPKEASDTKMAEMKTELKKEENAKHWFPTIFQNYLLNMETTIRNQGTYDHAASSTVSERCFWKFLQHAGAIKFVKDGDYYHEDWSTADKIKRCVIKGFGAVTSSSQASNSYNINNETYITIPASYGQMKYLLYPNLDNNMNAGCVYTQTSSDPNNLEGHDRDTTHGTFEIPLLDNRKYSDADPKASTYSTVANGEKDCLEMVFNTTDLRDEFAPSLDKLSYDDMAIDTNLCLGSEYNFNTVLVYYTIYDSVGNSIATNLFGVLITKNVEVDPDLTSGTEGSETLMKFPSMTKTKSQTGGFGSSYSIRLNIQTASIYDDTNATIIDYSTAESSTLTDFNTVVSSLKNTVDILKNNAVVLTNVYNNNQTMRYLVNDAMERVQTVERELTDYMHGNVRQISADEVDTNTVKCKALVGGSNIIDENNNVIATIEAHAGQGGISVNGYVNANDGTISELSTAKIITSDTSDATSILTIEKPDGEQILSVGNDKSVNIGNVKATNGTIKSATVSSSMTIGTATATIDQNNNVISKSPSCVTVFNNNGKPDTGFCTLKQFDNIYGPESANNPLLDNADIVKTASTEQSYAKLIIDKIDPRFIVDRDTKTLSASMLGASNVKAELAGLGVTLQDYGSDMVRMSTDDILTALIILLKKNRVI